MKQAKRKSNKRAYHRQRVRERLEDQVRLAHQAQTYLRRHRIRGDDSGCRHEWKVEGQTPTGYIRACAKCGRLRFG